MRPSVRGRTLPKDHVTANPTRTIPAACFGARVQNKSETRHSEHKNQTRFVPAIEARNHQHVCGIDQPEIYISRLGLTTRLVFTPSNPTSTFPSRCPRAPSLLFCYIESDIT